MLSILLSNEDGNLDSQVQFVNDQEANDIFADKVESMV